MTITGPFFYFFVRVDVYTNDDCNCIHFIGINVFVFMFSRISVVVFVSETRYLKSKLSF